MYGALQRVGGHPKLFRAGLWSESEESSLSRGRLIQETGGHQHPKSAKFSIRPTAYKGSARALPVDPFNDRLGSHPRPDSESLGPPWGEGLALFPRGVGVPEIPTKKKAPKSDAVVNLSFCKVRRFRG